MRSSRVFSLFPSHMKGISRARLSSQGRDRGKKPPSQSEFIPLSGCEKKLTAGRGEEIGIGFLDFIPPPLLFCRQLRRCAKGGGARDKREGRSNIFLLLLLP